MGLDDIEYICFSEEEFEEEFDEGFDGMFAELGYGFCGVGGGILMRDGGGIYLQSSRAGVKYYIEEGDFLRVGYKDIEIKNDD